MEPEVYCPDCGKTFPLSQFTPHREAEHPPRALSVAGAGGIRSQEAHGYQPTENRE